MKRARIRVNNQEVNVGACCEPSCRAAIVDLVKMVFPNNLIGYLSIIAKLCTSSQSCMILQADQNRRGLFIKWQNFPKIENSWELMSKIQDSKDFSLCGIRGCNFLISWCTRLALLFDLFRCIREMHLIRVQM